MTMWQCEEFWQACNIKMSLPGSTILSTSPLEALRSRGSGLCRCTASSSCMRVKSCMLKLRNFSDNTPWPWERRHSEQLHLLYLHLHNVHNISGHDWRKTKWAYDKKTYLQKKKKKTVILLTFLIFCYMGSPRNLNKYMISTQRKWNTHSFFCMNCFSLNPRCGKKKEIPTIQSL